MKPTATRPGVQTQIKNFRLQKGLTLAGLAATSGLSEGYLSQIERGTTEPSLTALRQIASGLQVPLVALLEEGTPLVSVTRAHQRAQLVPPGSEVTFHLLTPNLNRKIEFLHVEIPPGQSTYTEPVEHPGEEGHVVLEGRVLVEVDGEEHYLTEGDSIYFISTVKHRITNVSDSLAKIISVITPPTPRIQLIFNAQAE